MAKKSSSGLSVADLEKMLEARRSELSKLQARRESLLGELNQVDATIGRIEGSGTATKSVAKTVAKTVKKAAPKRTRKVVKKRKKKQVLKKVSRKASRGSRPKNDKPLGDYILSALKASKNGMTIEEIGQEVQKQGYKTNSANFKTVVYQFIYHSKKVDRDKKSGNYILK